MKTIKKVSVFAVYVDTTPQLELMEEGKIYISKEYDVAIHRCLCGCGSEVVTPLNDKNGWQLTTDGDKPTMTPSIGNYEFECRSHYIITKGIANFV